MLTVSKNACKVLTCSEYWIVMKANGFDEKTARGAFDMMDKTIRIV